MERAKKHVLLTFFDGIYNTDTYEQGGEGRGGGYKTGRRILPPPATALQFAKSLFIYHTDGRPPNPSPSFDALRLASSGDEIDRRRP
jgi:hypothetical protein